MEDCAAAIQTVQGDAGLMLAGVMVTYHLLVHLQMLPNILDHNRQGGVVLLAFGHIKTLWKNKSMSYLSNNVY